MSKWLVIGATGQLGQEICQVLKIHSVKFDTLRTKNLINTTNSQISELILSYEPQIIINCAAFTNVNLAENEKEIAMKLNAFLPELIAFSAKKLNAKFLSYSTDYIFPGDKKAPLRIDDLANPVNFYGKSKLIGENLILDAYPEGSIIFRTAWLYSRFNNNFVKTIIAKTILSTDNISIISDQFGQPTSAKDLAEQSFLSLNKNLPPGVYHATNSGKANWYQFALKIYQLLDFDVSRLIPILSDNIEGSVLRPKYSVLDNSWWPVSGVKTMRSWETALSDNIEQIYRVTLRELQI